MRLNGDFLKSELGEEIFLLPVGEAAKNCHGLVRLNETAAFIVDQLGQDTTEEEIVAALLKEYKAEPSAAKEHVHALIEKLRGIHAIVD